jgi:hypothetical protein
LLQIDRFRQGVGAIGEWMFAAGFAETLEQALDTCLQVQNLAGNAEMSGELQGHGKLPQTVRMAARINADGNFSVHLFAALHGINHEGLEQRYRQIVDAVVTAILERFERDTFPRAGLAADDDQVHGRNPWRENRGASMPSIALPQRGRLGLSEVKGPALCLAEGPVLSEVEVTK